MQKECGRKAKWNSILRVREMASYWRMPRLLLPDQKDHEDKKLKKCYNKIMGILDNLEAYLDLDLLGGLDMKEDIDKEDL